MSTYFVSLTTCSAQGIGLAGMVLNPVTSKGEERHLLDSAASLLGCAPMLTLQEVKTLTVPLSGIFFIAYSYKPHILDIESREGQGTKSLWAQTNKRRPHAI